jgi:hypothetical protein
MIMFGVANVASIMSFKIMSLICTIGPTGYYIFDLLAWIMKRAWLENAIARDGPGGCPGILGARVLEHSNFSLE